MKGDRVRQALIGGLAGGSVCLAEAAHASEGALQIYPDPGLLIVLLVAYLIHVPLLNYALFQPLLRVLADRAQRIDGARARAERVNHEAEASLARYESAIRAAAADAERERKAAVEHAQRAHAASLGTARTDAEGVIERARREVGAALVEARGLLEAQARDLARDAAARVLGRSLS
jgi:F-type H+-transporting ATPase subunit b